MLQRFRRRRITGGLLHLVLLLMLLTFTLLSILFLVPLPATASGSGNTPTHFLSKRNWGSFSIPVSAASMSSAEVKTMKVPPLAKKVKHEMEMFGDVRVDNYYWLRDDSRSKPEVLSYLRLENAYTDFVMSGTKHLEDQFYAEIRGRIKEDDVSAPIRRGSYYYYQRTLEGKEYVQHCRRLISNNDTLNSVYDIMPTGPDDPPEYVILDENIKAQEHLYYSIGAYKVRSYSLLGFTGRATLINRYICTNLRGSVRIYNKVGFLSC